MDKKYGREWRRRTTDGYTYEAPEGEFQLCETYFEDKKDALMMIRYRIGNRWHKDAIAVRADSPEDRDQAIAEIADMDRVTRVDRDWKVLTPEQIEALESKESPHA